MGGCGSMKKTILSCFTAAMLIIGMILPLNARAAGMSDALFMGASEDILSGLFDPGCVSSIDLRTVSTNVMLTGSEIILFVNPSDVQIDGQSDSINVFADVKFRNEDTLDKKKAITWQSSDEKVALVNEGEVTARSPGTAVISATCDDKSASFTVIVKKNPIQLKFKESGTDTVYLPVRPGKKVSTSISFINDNDEPVETDLRIVNEHPDSLAPVKAVQHNKKMTFSVPIDASDGMQTFLIKSSSSKVTATVNLVIGRREPGKKLFADASTQRLRVGESSSMTVSYGSRLSKMIVNAGVVFTSTRPSVVTIDQTTGKFKAVGSGQAILIAAYKGRQAVCKVMVD
jgi:hypothetical protein